MEPYPLKILIYGLNYAPELTGIGKYTGEMAAWLAARGHDVRVVTAPPYYPAWRVADNYRGRGYVKEGGGPGEPRVIRCPLYVPAVVTGKSRLIHLLSFALSSLPVVLREAMGGPDIVLTVEPAFFCAPGALAAAHLAQAPAWLHVQDFEIDAAFDLGLLPAGGLLHRFAAAMERGIMRGFARVSTLSKQMLARARRKGVARRRAILFPNWVDVDALRPTLAGSPNSFREELRLQDKTVLLYSGNMGGKQGLELLPEVARRLRDDTGIHFVFCGEGAFRPQMDRLCAGLANVTLLSLQPLERLKDLLNCADIHLLPQRADAADLVMPSKLTGMLASGRPVIATAAGGTEVAAVMAEGCGVTVPPGDAAAFADAVRQLSADAGARLAMGSCARRFAEERLGREQVLSELETDLLAAVAGFRR